MYVAALATPTALWMPLARLSAPSHVAGWPLVSVIQNGLLNCAVLSFNSCQCPVKPCPAIAPTHGARFGSFIVGSMYHLMRSSKMRSSGMRILLVTPAAVNFFFTSVSSDLNCHGL